MGSIRFTKGSFYLTWFVSPRTSFCSVSRTATYVTRMRGCVGGALSDGRPYPDRIGVIYMDAVQKENSPLQRLQMKHDVQILYMDRKIELL